MAEWDPFDQSAGAAEWFDAEYMFGITDGFDVVIGNPPYVESRNQLLSDKLKNSYIRQVQADWGETLPRGSDLLMYFFPRSAKFLNSTGFGCFITQNAWLNTNYGQKFQKFSIGRFCFQNIIDTSAKFFADTESQNINAVIAVFTKSLVEKIEYKIISDDMKDINRKTIMANHRMKWGHLFAMPKFFAEILSNFPSPTNASNVVSFGQGLNFPKQDLNQHGANIPIIVKAAQFVAFSTDGNIANVSSSRQKKVPALVMPRGVGNRYYCTFNSCKAFSYSHVELYLPKDLWESEIHYCLWAYMNSSLVWLFREITGRKNLGGSLLKAEATDMKDLPIDFNFDFFEDAKNIFNSIKNREPLPVEKEIYTEEHLFIDDIIANYFGFSEKQEKIRKALVEQVNFRLSR